MPLTAPEEVQVARAFLKCFGENAQMCGRALRFVAEFSVGAVDLLSTLQSEALTWQPFLDARLVVPDWNAEVARYYDAAGLDI